MQDIVPLRSKPQKTTRTSTDTIEFTPDEIREWKLPPFQRPLRVNDKVLALSQTIKEDAGVLPGVITLGIMAGETYLVDGQHRREAFLLSGCKRGYVDVRYRYFDSLEDMGQEFVEANLKLVNMRPDDIMRGLEGTSKPLARIRQQCPYVGYDSIRRGTTSPILSMSMLLRCWFGSAPEVPTPGGQSAIGVARTLSMEEVDTILEFLDCAYKAWGRDLEYARLWGSLNLVLCMWLYRRLVITPYSPKTAKLTKDQFTKCLMSVSASGQYIDWLQGRQLRDRDRSPAFNKLKVIFARRLQQETGKKPLLPAPAWVSHSGSGRGV